MITNAIRMAGMGGLCLLWSVQSLLAQAPAGPMPGKAIRTKTAVDTRALNPVIIRGQDKSVTPSNTSGRTVPVAGKTYLPGRKAAPFAKTAADSLVPAGVEVKWSAQSGLPIAIREGKDGFKPAAANGRIDVTNLPVAYLSRVKNLLKISNPENEFTIRERDTDALQQTHARLKQTYRGVEVYGSELVVHTQDSRVLGLNGRHFPTPDLKDVTPKLSADQAIKVATGDVSSRTAYRSLSPFEQQLLDCKQAETKLVIYHPDDNPDAERLVWQVTVRPNFLEVWEYFVDAKTGLVLHKFNHTCSFDGPFTASAKDLNGVSRTINTYQTAGKYYCMDGSRPMFSAAKSKLPDSPVGGIWTIDAKNTYGKNFAVSHISTTNNVWNNPAAVSAHFNAGKSFEYFKNVHGRNALDGNGNTMISIVNVVDEDGKGLDNAYWNGKAMFYGNGRVGFKPLAGGLDVAGHEMSHGVIGNTARLEYQDQSGAINESMADVFGTMIDPEDWLLGEDIVQKSYFKSGAMRSLSDPHNGGSSLNDPGYQPRHMSEFYAGDEDNGGVHINSGIPNFAFYKFATEVGKPKAEKVYYRALTNYLTAKSQFVDLRLAVVQAATDLHGANSTEVAAAKRAFDAVGILETGGTGNQNPPDLPTNTGQDFIICHDASEGDSDPNTWYVVTPTGTNLNARSKTPGRSRPSVTDRGDVAYFVGMDRKIHAVTLTGTPQEIVIQNEAIWNNVSISKDGKRLAAVTNAADASVYVYNFDTRKWAKFALYNPTSSEGIETGEVRFADAIEWDYTGEYLLYDAFNVISSQGGQPVQYWDVGIIKVWDRQKRNFGPGTIEKIFTSLPDNVSIGNPSFSKNSPTIVAFDYVNSGDDSYAVLGADLKNGKVATIAENTTLGYPTFSKTDDRVAFTAYTAAGDTVINVIPLKPDKINPNGAATTIVTEAKWTVWYAQGERQILNGAKEITSFQFGGLSAAAPGIINGTNIQVTVPPDANLKTLIAYFSHSPNAQVKVGNAEQVSGVTKNDFSQPVVYTVVAQDGSTKNYTVSVAKGVNTGAEDLQDVSGEVVLYPNPNRGAFSLKWEKRGNTPVRAEVFSAAGVKVFGNTLPARTAPEEEVSMQLPPLPAGVYHLRLQTKENVVLKKLLIQ